MAPAQTPTKRVDEAYVADPRQGRVTISLVPELSMGDNGEFRSIKFVPMTYREAEAAGIGYAN